MERPILFSAPMVRAILDGTKTQTRRVIKWPSGCDEFWRENGRPWLLGFGGGGYESISDGLIQVEDAPVLRACPYGAPGGLLWVRETWGYHPTVSGNDDVIYAADYTDGSDRAAGAKYKPSIHMPRWASRLTLRVTDVRAERLQEISHADALAEGLDLTDTRVSWEVREQSARVPFARLWDSINAKRGYGWDTNPWVWVVAFERLGAE